MHFRNTKITLSTKHNFISLKNESKMLTLLFKARHQYLVKYISNIMSSFVPHIFLTIFYLRGLQRLSILCVLSPVSGSTKFLEWFTGSE